MEKKLNYGYTNNGVFPVRYIKRERHVQQNVSPELPNYNPYLQKITENRKASLENLNIGFKTLGISDVTRKKIALACRVLSYCAEPRKVRNGKGEYITHLTKFITLTLPSEQKHTDQEVTKLILGTFLDRCRKLSLLNNYVWRAEKQRNGNIHYHLITDTFCSFTLLRNIWYISLRAHGYLQAYSEKFKGMSLAEYASQPFNAKTEITTIAARFARGNRNNWQEPPCIDVKDINDISGISQYISKYVSKDDAKSDDHVKGRVWGCSQSVSASVKLFKTDVEFNKFWFEAGRSILRRKQVDFDYFSFVKCSYQSITAWFKDCRIYAKNLLRTFFTPCDFWRNSVGLFTPS